MKVEITPDEIKSIDDKCNALESSIYYMCMAVLSNLASDSDDVIKPPIEKEDGINNLYITHSNGLVIRIRIEVEPTLYSLHSIPEDKET